MGSDGLWDRLENHWVTEKIEEFLTKEEKENSENLVGSRERHSTYEYNLEPLSKVTSLLVEEAMKRNSTDNISVITIHLNEKSEEEKKVLQSTANNENITIHMSKSKLNNRNRFEKLNQSENQDKMLDLNQRIKTITENVNKMSRSSNRQ